MANAYSVSPQGLTFNKLSVQGAVLGLYPTAQTLAFTFTNNSGASVNITNWGYSNGTSGDSVTQPNGILQQSDFTVAVVPVGTPAAPATSTFGPPGAPGLAASTTGGSLATGTLFVKVTWTTALGESLTSAETSVAVTGPTASVTVTQPASPPANVTSWSVYTSATTGIEKFNANIPIGTATYLVTADGAGANAPASISAVTYFAKITYTTSTGETAASSESSQAAALNALLVITSPIQVNNASGYNVYVSTTTGTETKQNSVPIAIGTNWQEPNTGLIGGAAAPSTSTVSTSFPIIVANGFSQSFNVTFAPIRRGSSFGDIRSALIVLFAGSVALSNSSIAVGPEYSAGTVIPNNGEPFNLSRPNLLTVGVGGTVVQEAFDNNRVHPIFWPAGTLAQAAVGASGLPNNVKGVSPNYTLADLDTTFHGSPMLFFVDASGLPYTPSTGSIYLVTGNQAETTPRAFKPALYTTGSSTVPYAGQFPAVNGSPRGGRGYQILTFFADDTLSIDIIIRAVTTAGHVTVATFLQVNYSNSAGLFIGNGEGLNLQGLSLTVQTANATNTTTGYNIGAVVTG